jgi:hypothetical protein
MVAYNSFTAITNGSQLNEGYFNGIFSVLSPIGSVVAWLKSYTNTPALSDNWVECNGQTLSDSDSVYNGQVIPNLNGAVATGLKGRFLRGHSTSGVLEDSQNLAHTHGFRYPNGSVNTNDSTWSNGDTKILQTESSGGTEARPYNYSVVWIMRIK